MENLDQFKYLYERYLVSKATAEETDQLFLYIANEKNNEQLKELLGQTWDQLQIAPGSVNITPVTIPEHNIAPVRKMIAWRRIAVAASIIFAIGIASYFIWFNPASRIPEPVSLIATDVEAPEASRAMITLANGQKIYLDSAVNGQLATQGDVKVFKTADGKIEYDDSRLTTPDSRLTYNTLSNPRGSKVIDMLLADGSRVWLNAGSAITYPVAFVGNERKVSITGEAYFEISKAVTASGTKQPFIVSKGDMAVQVLGTHFNVNAYDDESEIKVTLLEGSIKVSNSGQSVTIKPGQQARITSNQQPATSNSVDLDAVMAWKNGKFQFNDASIETVMNQIARWYDVEVIYQDKPTKIFRGGTSRNMSAANVFKVLEETGGVHFRIEGKRVIVMK